MITLDAITLPPSLTWADRDAWQPSRHVVRTALDGRPVVYHSPLQGGRPITLASTESSGWMRRDTLDALQALAATPGATYPLVISDDSFTVLFRHDDAPALSAEPLVARTNHDPGDFFRVTIKLMAF